MLLSHETITVVHLVIKIQNNQIADSCHANVLIDISCDSFRQSTYMQMFVGQHSCVSSIINSHAIEIKI